MSNKSTRKVATQGGGILVREARKIFRYTDVEPKRPARGTTYRPKSEWKGPKGPDGKPRSYVDPDGNVHIAPGDKRPYLNPNNRPTFRKGVVEKVWEKARRNKQGEVVDPAGRKVEWDPGSGDSRPWDMGHKPGQKYSDEYAKYLEGKPPYDQGDSAARFRDWYNTPENYRVEHPTTNRSHRHE